MAIQYKMWYVSVACTVHLNKDKYMYNCSYYLYCYLVIECSKLMFGIPFLSSLNASRWHEIFQGHESQMKQKYLMHNLYVKVRANGSPIWNLIILFSETRSKRTITDMASKGWLGSDMQVFRERATDERIPMAKSDQKRRGLGESPLVDFYKTT